MVPSIPDLDLDIVSDAGTWHVTVHGDLDIATLPLLEDRLGAIPMEDAIELDMRPCGFASARTAGRLSALQSTRRRTGGDLVVARASRQFRRVVGATGLESLLERRPRVTPRSRGNGTRFRDDRRG